MADAAASLFMCLKCRGRGHVVSGCSEPWTCDDLEWFFSPSRKAMDVANFSDTLNRPLCKRCQELNLLDFMKQEIPWNSMLSLTDIELRESGCTRSLGQTGSIVFRQDCSLCCCLFAMTPSPRSDNQEAVIFPTWTMARLEGGISIDTAEKRLYARCLLVTLDPMFDTLSLAETAQRGDALVLLEDDDIDPDTTLSGRLISPQHINVDIVKQWLSTCSKLHPVTCCSVWSEELRDILLIDVESRILVRYPPERCHYLAISYVWGPIIQKSHQVGARMSDLPQTIEDAMTFTLQLGKRYLWVDSVCIDQGNEVEKHEQIAKMSMIYRGADATIIALSGETAKAGLPRMSSNGEMYPQLKCCVDGKRLVGLMPTLSQQVWMSAWGSRAWTLQEALLAPRCLYISDHQMYFECNAMQCCESLNEARSWVHQTNRDAEFLRDGHSEPSIGAGVLRSPFVGSTHVNNRLEQYTVLANLYSYRRMTDPEDALNAFSAIIQYLTEIEYSKGFCWGLPVEDLNWALTWNAKSPPDRRLGFPTWSWAGWDAALAETTPFDIKHPHFFHVYLKMWRLDQKQKHLLPILSLPRVAENDMEKVEVLSEDDPLFRFMQSDSNGADFNISMLSTTDSCKYLFTEGLVLHFVLDYTQPRVNEIGSGRYEYFDVLIADIYCLVKIMSTDPIIHEATQQQPETCLLLARDQSDHDMFFHLLVLEQEGDVAKRKGVITLQIPKEHPEVLNQLDMQKKKLILT